MKFSIIIPTFNSDRFIDECLKSIFDLDFLLDCFEVIVVDGGSTDDTLEIVRKYSLVKIIHSENISIANSRNLGAKEAKGTILAFIDSDCLVDRDLLTKAEKHLEKFDCCGSFYKSYSGHSWVARTWLVAEKKKSGIVNWITSGTLIVKRSLFFKIGGFNELLETEEDEDFGYRTRRAGGKLFNDLSMASIHLGQPNNVFDFFRKEMWRGKSLLKPRTKKYVKKLSLFDLMILVYFFNLWLMVGAWIFHSKILFLLSILFMFLIPLALTIRKVLQTSETNLFIKMYTLFFFFLFARCLSLLRYNQFMNLFKRKCQAFSRRMK